MNRIRLETSSEPGDVKKRRVMNFVAKILCIIFAFLIWFYVYSNDSSKQTVDFTVDIEFRNEDALKASKDWSLLNGKGSKLELTLSGKKNVISKLTENDVKAYVDLSAVENSGEQDLEIIVNKPSECTVEKQSSTVIHVNIDKLVSKTVPVSVDTAKVSVYSDTQIDDPVPSLTEVSIQGPRSEVDRVVSARAVLDFGSTILDSSISQTTTLELVDKNGEVIPRDYVTVNNSRLAVSVTVELKLYADKKVPLKVDYKYGYFNDDNVVVTLDPPTVTLRGEPKTLAGIDSVTLITLDEKQYGRDNVSFTTSLTVPSGVTNLSGNSVTVDVRHINTSTRTIPVSKFALVNDAGLECSVKTDSVNVTFRGPYYELSLLKSEDVTGIIDMKMAVQGTNNPSLRFKIDGDNASGIYEIGSYYAEVEVE